MVDMDNGTTGTPDHVSKSKENRNLSNVADSPLEASNNNGGHKSASSSKGDSAVGGGGGIMDLLSKHKNGTSTNNSTKKKPPQSIASNSNNSFSNYSRDSHANPASTNSTTNNPAMPSGSRASAVTLGSSAKSYKSKTFNNKNNINNNNNNNSSIATPVTVGDEGEINLFINTSVLKKNPRDAASPRRRPRHAKTKSQREYESQVDSLSHANSSLGGGTGAPSTCVTSGSNISMYPYHASPLIPTASSVGSKSSRSSKSTSRTKHSKQSNLQYRQNYFQKEQTMFEHKLCDRKGVAIKKINPNGKAQLRNVRCIRISSDSEKRSSRRKQPNMSQSVPPALEHTHRSKPNYGGMPSSSNRSVSSLTGRLGGGGGGGVDADGRKRSSNTTDSPTISQESASPTKGDDGGGVSGDGGGEGIVRDNTWYHKHTRALTWGTKKKVIPIYKFTCVRKGKTTDRTKRNACPATRLLTLVNETDRHGSLDIEAPTKQDRDKFALAFSTFLSVPLLEDAVGGRGVGGPLSTRSMNDSDSLPSISSYASSAITGMSMATPQGLEYQIGGDLLPTLTPSPSSSKEDKFFLDGNHNDLRQQQSKEFDMLSPVTPKEPKICDFSGIQPGTRGHDSQKKKEEDGVSDVSSLTQGFDQELVEELHQALDELRTELEASRAEAARAVKVAEQAIQSAESCSSNDWNKTVTHKAAEAAAQAQKRSAEAIVKQRAAEERLMAERKSAAFWRKQAQIAEEEVGVLQTRVAGAEIDLATTNTALEHDKRKAASYILSLKQNFSKTESIQVESLARKTDQNRLLEIELESTRNDFNAKKEELKVMQENLIEMKTNLAISARAASKKKFFGNKGKKGRGDLLLDSPANIACLNLASGKKTKAQDKSVQTEQILKLQAEATAMRKQFDLLKRTTFEELQQLPEEATEWASKISKALVSSQGEVSLLKGQLAMERNSRRKLLNDVQNLRGTVRVYCLPKPLHEGSTSGEYSPSRNLVTASSQEIGLLHRELVLNKQGTHEKSIEPMTFEFDRMFTSNISQSDVYSEMEDLIQGVMDGYNSCIMAYGQTNTGKTRSLLGDISFQSLEEQGNLPQVEITNRGVQLIAAENLFKIAKHRGDRFQDVISMTIVEVCNEKLFDMVAETKMAERRGQIQNIGSKASKGRSPKTAENESESISKQRKLEIRTNHDGEIIVQGVTSIPLSSYNDVLQLWKESLASRSIRLAEEGTDIKEWEATSHIIATIQVFSTNVVTGGGTVGKIQFVDFAGSDTTPKRVSSAAKHKPTSTENVLAPIGNTQEWKFVNKSIGNLVEVIDARHQYSRSVPYRNSTLTHLLQDSLEADTKVLLLACVSSNVKDLQETANTMRFASKIRKVVIGKATKHTITFA